MLQHRLATLLLQTELSYLMQHRRSRSSLPPMHLLLLPLMSLHLQLTRPQSSQRRERSLLMLLPLRVCLSSLPASGRACASALLHVVGGTTLRIVWPGRPRCTRVSVCRPRSRVTRATTI